MLSTTDSISHKEVLGVSSKKGVFLFEATQSSLIHFALIALIILFASLDHVMLIDIVKLDPLLRILSFITLRLGLPALDFVYNRWQERLKHIL